MLAEVRPAARPTGPHDSVYFVPTVIFAAERLRAGRARRPAAIPRALQRPGVRVLAPELRDMKRVAHDSPDLALWRPTRDEDCFHTLHAWG